MVLPSSTRLDRPLCWECARWRYSSHGRQGRPPCWTEITTRVETEPSLLDSVPAVKSHDSTKQAPGQQQGDQNGRQFREEKSEWGLDRITRARAQAKVGMGGPRTVCHPGAMHGVRVKF